MYSVHTHISDYHLLLLKHTFMTKIPWHMIFLEKQIVAELVMKLDACMESKIPLQMFVQLTSQHPVCVTVKLYLFIRWTIK
jgi:hypothetical protein